jgi:hypothetical protein
VAVFYTQKLNIAEDLQHTHTPERIMRTFLMWVVVHP